MEALSAEVERLAGVLAAGGAYSPHLQQQFDAALSRLEAAAESTGRTPQVLAALGLGGFAGETPVAHLSGGQKTRLALARVLLGDPQLLLLDEPTNHLDIAMLVWLEGWLRQFRGAALIVSHDRAFLDGVVDGVLDLNAETHTLRAYAGNYSAYVSQVAAEHDKQWEAYQDQVYEIRRIQQDIQRTKQQSLRVEQTTTPRQPHVRRIAKKVARKAISRERKLERYLASEERVEKPRTSWQLQQDFFAAGNVGAGHFSQAVLRLEGLSVGYPGAAPLLAGLDLHIRQGQRIALTGANGSGKTTLLRTIAGVLSPLAGTAQLGTSVRLGYMTQEQEGLKPEEDALGTLRRFAPLNETEARTFLHKFLFSGDEVFTPVGALSYGERARLMLGCLVAQGSTFLLLDEPVNHLDIPSRVRFEQALKNFDGTVLAVVHDRYFIREFASEIWWAEGRGIRVEYPPFDI
ncbi:MAG: ATP-binding cassette domain-containing protein [Anaerolineales bacterium]|nr:ATP-binding cassette domain-containing protein [Anaerolineales bacterium]